MDTSTEILEKFIDENFNNDLDEELLRKIRELAFEEGRTEAIKEISEIIKKTGAP